MALTKIDSALIGDGAITADKIATGAVTAAKVAEGVAGGPKITNIQVTNNSYTVLDDTAVDLNGGYIKLTGTGFAAGCQVMINNTPATSTTFVSSTEVRAQVPAQSAGSYVVYLVNSDGGVAIRINGITYSASPVWVTGSTLSTQQQDVAISIQLSATGASTYALAAGSTLPTGVTLSAGGLLSGTVTGLGADTTYSFTVNAVDTENQDSPRTFSLPVSIIIPDPYFAYTTLLVRDNGSNTAQNNTFIDSSTNALTITRNGNTTQGAFSPFSPTGWSAYYDSTSTRWSGTLWYDLSQQTFTAEFWMWPTAAGGGYGGMIFGNNQSGAADSSWIYFGSDRKVGITTAGTSNYTNLSSTTAIPLNTWTHVAITISGAHTTATGKIYINGVLDTTVTNMSTDIHSIGETITGSRGDNTYYNYYGYLSNLRIVKGQVLYTGNFTPATAKLTTSSVGTSGANVAASITGTVTVLLFADNNLSNRGSITAAPTSNSARVDAFSAVTPDTAWSAATHGGSAYFDGTGDYLGWSGSSIGTGNFTIETWFYASTNLGSTFRAIVGDSTGGSGNGRLIVHESLVRMDSAFVSNQDFSVSIRPYSWNHLVFVRDTSIGTTVFLNGVRSSTGINNSSVNYGTLNAVGMSYWDDDWIGYLSGFKLTVGTAVYSPSSTTISVPTAPPTAIASTSLLLNFTNAGIYDATAKNVIETVGDAQVSTAVKKYGTGSMYFDGTGDALGIRASQNFSFGTGDFTYEMWVYLTSYGNSGSYGLFCGAGASGQADQWLINNTNNGRFVYYDGATSFVSSDDAAGKINLNQWTHIAVSRSGTTLRMFKDGSQVATGTSNISITIGATNTFYIGNRSGGAESPQQSLFGYIDDLRITRGYARYTSNFTPPTREFTAQ